MPQGQDNKPPNQRAAASPVLIPLHNDYASPGIGGDDSLLPEWAMIELNGELIAPTTTTIPNNKDKENPSTNDNEPYSSLLGHDQVELGSVRFVNNKPVMILGTHELEGKVESLKQPFCVLEKETTASPTNINGSTSYRVGGIVTQKLLFDKYPKVILR